MGYLLVKSVQTFYLLLILVIAAGNALNDTTVEDELYRILNGEKPREPIRYQVSIQQARGIGKYSHLCSGVVINPEYILTAASCIDRQDKNRLSVLAGVTDLLSTAGSRRSIQGYKVHDGYLANGVNNIAIAKVTPALDLNATGIDSISFTNTTEVGSGTHVHLSGWGKLFSFLPMYPRNLQLLSATIITNARCQQSRPQVTDGEICTIRSFMRGACTGDEGGPVTDTDGSSLIAIISLAAQPCGIGLPDVHTKIAPFSAWITAKMAETWT